MFKYVGNHRYGVGDSRFVNLTNQIMRNQCFYRLHSGSREGGGAEAHFWRSLGRRR